MPRLSCWFVRSALIHLAIGISLGSLLLFHKGVPLHPFLWRLLPLHVELLLFGWVVQLTMGVAFWIFPRFWRSRGDERPAWLAFGLLNLGVWLAGAGIVLGVSPLLIFVGRLLETGAAAAFAIHAWSRVKPPGATPQPKPGES